MREAAASQKVEEKKHVVDLSGTGGVTNDALVAVQISTIIVHDEIVIVGGFFSEVMAKNLRSSVVHSKRITYDENVITNASSVFDGRLLTSSNYCHVRMFDL